ncbi:MAG: 2,3,4,5-tetrahydropyridine-2,6-dicarboxylate N-succinyltransferase [Bacteroidetes bacterium]|nr:2,3,4,5-tetrahydropyridine-2,6-dicarboxylate N-succinyltransferase [Bacteroidota bacterium]
MDYNSIRREIEKYFTTNSSKDNIISSVLISFLESLNTGQIRSAEKQNNKWTTNSWVKQGILLLFKYGDLVEVNGGLFNYFEKDTLGLKQLSLSDNVRVVMGGSAIRNGCYVGKGVICMPPCYINIGAYIDKGTMIDSHALVGTCAQIGKNVHISAAAQIGGVLEPIGANPVIIEDNVMVGGNCGIYEGVIVKQNAILGSGVILNSSTKVYDLVNENILTNPLEIPENAVVVQGSRGINTNFGLKNKLSISTPLIVKYRDAKTDAKTELENALR